QAGTRTDSSFSPGCTMTFARSPRSWRIAIWKLPAASAPLTRSCAMRRAGFPRDCLDLEFSRSFVITHLQPLENNKGRVTADVIWLREHGHEHSQGPWALFRAATASVHDRRRRASGVGQDSASRATVPGVLAGGGSRGHHQ